MARRCDEAQAKTLEIVERIVQGVDFQLAAVARAGIDLTDRQAASQPPPRGAVDLACKPSTSSPTRGGASVSGR
jgi:hypothetical protein